MRPSCLREVTTRSAFVFTHEHRHAGAMAHGWQTLITGQASRLLSNVTDGVQTKFLRLFAEYNAS